MAVRIDHVTLVIDTISTLTFTGPGNKVKVVVLSAASAVDPIYFTVGTATVPPANPVVGADDIYSVPSLADAQTVVSGLGSSMEIQVKLLAHVAHQLRVELISGV